MLNVNKEEWMQQYLNLLIIQYYNKPKAREEIYRKIERYYDIYKSIIDFYSAYDVDSAVGLQLDHIGRIVGVARNIAESEPNTFFGYNNAPYTTGYSDAPYRTINDRLYSSRQLNDTEYRYIIKAKIAFNNVSCFLYNSEDRLSLQDAYSIIFNNRVAVIDTQLMSIDILLSNDVSYREILLVQKTGLLPRPAGVRIRNIMRITDNSFFQNQSIPYQSNPYVEVLSFS